jgi:predicted PurR-regulated permease PerM
MHAASAASDSGGYAAGLPLSDLGVDGVVTPSQRYTNEFMAFLQELPWRRVSIWGIVVLSAYQMKDFFGIAMGTFIISFIGNGFVQTAQHAPVLDRLSPTLRRHSMVLLYFLIIVSVLGLFAVLTAPDIIREASDFVTRLKSDNVWTVVLEKMRHGLGDGMMDQLERVLSVASGDQLAYTGNAAEWTAQRTQAMAGVLHKLLHTYTDTAISVTTGLVTSITRFAVQAGVSMVLSFMILWDLTTIRAGVTSLRTSRLAPVYEEIAPSFAIFGTLFGKALQAQARIALANTGLTALGMWGMQIPGIGLLSLFVFICSFIPIAGVFISTTPIAFVALTEYGFMKLAITIAMVIGIHFVEAYGLNPAIYSAHLKLHPLMVLSVLVIAEHSLGVWGLLLAVPLTVFLLDYCIRYPTITLTDVAANELEVISSIDRDFEPQSPAVAVAAKETATKEKVKVQMGSQLGQLG